MQKVEIVSGEDFGLVFEVFTEGATSSASDDVPMSIAGYAAKIELRMASTGGRTLKTWIDGSPELTRNDASGTVTLDIPHTDTALFTFDVAYMDLLLTGPDNGVRSEAIEITLYKGVTRWP